MTPRLLLAVLLAIGFGGVRETMAQSQGEPPLPRSAYESRTAFVPAEKQARPGNPQPVNEPMPTAEPELAAPPQANPIGSDSQQPEEEAATREPLEEPTATKSRSLPLPSPSKRLADVPQKGEPAARGRAVSLPSITTVLASLAIVVGLFLLLAWMLRRSLPRGSRLLPGEAVEVLGRTPLAQRQFMHLLRVGNKLLLVSVSSTGVEPLTEITDPIEVDRLAGLCKQGHPSSSTSAFRQVFQQFGNQNAVK